MSMPMPSNSFRRNKIRGGSVHAVRLAVLALILTLVHWTHDRSVIARNSASLEARIAGRLQTLFGSDSRIQGIDSDGRARVVNATGETVGYALQTSPIGDRFLGFSGPTNVLIAFDRDTRIKKIEVLYSGDTRDHVALIEKESGFLSSWIGLTASQASERSKVEHTAGATLTSMAMTQAIRLRMGATEVEPRFSEPLDLETARLFFKEADSIHPSRDRSSIWEINDARGVLIGMMLRTSPAADEIVGYQGPTETTVGLDLDGKVVGIAVGQSFDNEPHVGYVRKDRSFSTLLKKYSLDDLARIRLEEEGIEGVSGATMTSMAVAQGIVKASQDYLNTTRIEKSNAAQQWSTIKHAIGTALVVGFGAAIGLTKWRGRRGIRRLFQWIVLIYLGLVQGELLSVAMFAGWVQSGIPWQNAIGLVILSVAALALPIFAETNLYCSHLCPHGAAQQLLPRRFKLKSPLPSSFLTILRWIRPLLIAWTVLVLCVPFGFSLVNIEAFDAYAWRAAALPSLIIAVVGLIGSLFIPMGYCHYGCVTGSLLQYIRQHSKTYRIGRADYFAIGCLCAAGMLYWIKS
jgi:transcriptional regulator of nitric oxide reductase